MDVEKVRPEGGERAGDEEEQAPFLSDKPPPSSTFPAKQSSSNPLTAAYTALHKSLQGVLAHTPAKNNPYILPAFLIVALLLAVILVAALVPGALFSPSSLTGGAGCLSVLGGGGASRAAGGVPHSAKWPGLSQYQWQSQHAQFDDFTQSIMPFQITPAGPFGFVRFSSYRLNAQSVSAVGVGSIYLKDHLRAEHCEWVEGSGLPAADGSQAPKTKGVNGQLKVIYTESQGDKEYDTMIITCELPESTGPAGGAMVADIGNTRLTLYRQTVGANGQAPALEAPPDDELPHVLTVCAFQLQEPTEPRLMYEWVAYHYHMGATRFRLYDGGFMDASSSRTFTSTAAVVTDVLDPWLRNGTVEVVPFKDVLRFGLADQGQILGMHDCLLSSRFNSRWVLALEPNSYLFIQPPSSFFPLLAHYTEKAWVSIGSQLFESKKCRDGHKVLRTDEWWPARDAEPFLVEFLTFRAKEIWCDDGQNKQRCLGKAGERTFMGNPRKVERVGLHEVTAPVGGQDSGEDLTYDQMHRNVYPSLHLAAEFNHICDEKVANDAFVEDLAADTTAADVARRLRYSNLPDREEAAESH